MKHAPELYLEAALKLWPHELAGDAGPLVQTAGDRWSIEDDIVDPGENGAWVMAWIRVTDDDVDELTTQSSSCEKVALPGST